MGNGPIVDFYMPPPVIDSGGIVLLVVHLLLVRPLTTMSVCRDISAYILSGRIVQ